MSVKARVYMHACARVCCACVGVSVTVEVDVQVGAAVEHWCVQHACNDGRSQVAPAFDVRKRAEHVQSLVRVEQLNAGQLLPDAPQLAHHFSGRTSCRHLKFR